MKIIGAIVIVVVCWALGVDFYKSNMNKLSFSKGLFDGVAFLKSEIVYTCDLLGESVLKSAEFSGAASDFMKTVGKALKEQGVCTAAVFEIAEPTLAKNTTKEAYLLTKDLFLQLGEKDSDSHEKMLDGYLKKLETVINKQNDFCGKECVMLKKVGTVIGIGIAVLLI